MRKYEEFRYRRDARVVAAIDLIISLLLLGFLIIATIFFIIREISLLPESPTTVWINRPREEVIVELLILSGRFLLNAVQLGVALTLFVSTQEGREGGVNGIKLWIYFSYILIFILIGQLGLIGSEEIVAKNPVAIVISAGEIFFRVIGILFVSAHRRERENPLPKVPQPDEINLVSGGCQWKPTTASPYPQWYDFSPGESPPSPSSPVLV